MVLIDDSGVEELFEISRDHYYYYYYFSPFC